jgi:hypothetical protein
MMRCDSFARGVVFSAAVAAGCLPWALLVGPISGAWNAQALYLIGATAAYVAVLAPRGRGLPAAAVTAVVAAAIAVLARNTTELAIGLAAIIAVARSAVLYAAPLGRALLRETALTLGGLAFARYLASSTLPSTGIAVWGFFLVQSLFFLFAPATRRGRGAGVDPFDEAYRRALALMDRTSIL